MFSAAPNSILFEARNVAPFSAAICVPCVRISPSDATTLSCPPALTAVTFAVVSVVVLSDLLRLCSKYGTIPRLINSTESAPASAIELIFPTTVSVPPCFWRCLY